MECCKWEKCRIEGLSRRLQALPVVVADHAYFPQREVWENEEHNVRVGNQKRLAVLNSFYYVVSFIVSYDLKRSLILSIFD